MKVYVITEEISFKYEDFSEITSIVAIYDSKEKAIYYLEQYVKDSGYTIIDRGKCYIDCENEYQKSYLRIEDFEVEL